MTHGKPKLHLYWIAPRKGYMYRTACGKRLRDVQVTTRIPEVTCKVCRSTIYGTKEKSNA